MRRLPPHDEEEEEERSGWGRGRAQPVMEKGRKPDLMSLCLATLALTCENRGGNRSIRREIDPSHDFNFTSGVRALALTAASPNKSGP